MVAMLSRPQCAKSICSHGADLVLLAYLSLSSTGKVSGWFILVINQQNIEQIEANIWRFVVLLSVTQFADNFKDYHITEYDFI